MTSSSRASVRHYWVALRAMLVFTLVLGVAYPLVVTAVAQTAFPWRANGSPLSSGAEPVGSALLGQSFTDADGQPLLQWFQPRPSAAGDGYDAAASSGSNWGPENADLVQAIEDRKAGIAEADALSPADIPSDAVTASASGLDPHISPTYALQQVARIAAIRDLPEEKLQQVVESKIQGRDLGFLGDPTVNVLELNLALREMDN
jgi:potassium-transporting ATPase KdpC subunit